MNEENDLRLVRAFPLLYADRHGSKQSTLMCWGFACGDGWYDIIWELSEKLEPLIKKFVDDNPNLECSNCGCSKDRHYACLTRNPGKCLSIHVNPDSDEEPPSNYFACFCDSYVSCHPKAVQVKEKFGGLRFYMTSGNDEIYDLIGEAEAKSYKTCEECGEPGEEKPMSWIRTLCDGCYENWEQIRAERAAKWNKEND